MNLNNVITSPQIEEFRKSITPDLFDIGTYIGWADIETNLSRYHGAITFLQSLTSEAAFTAGALEAGLREHSHLYQVAAALLALPQGEIGFGDGRELPDPTRSPPASRYSDIASLLIDLGFGRLIKPGVSVEDLVRITLLSQDAGHRRYRVGSTIKDRLQSVLEQAIAQANQNHDIIIEIEPEAQWTPGVRGRVEAVLAVGSRQCIAVTSLFQTALGGRQQTQLSNEYPALQRDLAEYGLNLILVADGRGVRGARDSVLQSLMSGVASCMTFQQAASGKLLTEMLRLAAAPPPTQRRRALKELIHAAIISKGSISTTELPGEHDQARIALASYANENKELDLALNPTGIALAWRRKELVDMANGLTRTFQSEKAIECFFMATGGNLPVVTQHNGTTYAVEDLKDGGDILPKRLVVAASSHVANADLFKRISGIALSTDPESKIAVLLSPTFPDLETGSGLRLLQRSLTSSVIVLDASLLLTIAQSKEPPLAILARQALEQSDLVKASPFVVNSVTPTRICYGREKEDADMVSTLASNSIALLGGRRIGKTSLMRHAAAKLREGGFETYFGDCQTVRDWTGFAEMAKRAWQVQTTTPFRPANLFDVVKQLKKTTGSKVVILLDEIDQLLDWDKHHTSEEVPEAFFRACRTVSQEGEAQFVFSGERTISSRVWDPQSPHWNFCAPFMLRQIDRPAAQQLLMKPLSSMQITIADKERFASVAWNRTSGHPQLIQTLGHELVGRINERSPSARASVSSDDLLDIANTYSYAERYLETYWGQANDLERLLTMLIATGAKTLESCREYLHQNGAPHSDSEIKAALRMIELYGITDSSAPGYQLRLDWFNDAITFYGTGEKLIQQYIAKLQ